MCWCRPEIRTPFCGRQECVPPEKKIENLKAELESKLAAATERAEAAEKIVTAAQDWLDRFNSNFDFTHPHMEREVGELYKILRGQR